jgi:CheY-like chemotaxis protein
MAENAAAEETRVAEAVARLLARQSSLLARATDDAAAASATRLGLSWLTDLMRSFDLHGAADWFQALKSKGEERGTTAAWPVLGAPLCEALSGRVSRECSLAPLGAEAGNWAAHVAQVGAFEEPIPEEAHDPGPPQTPEIEPEPQPEPQVEPGPVPPPREEPPLPTAPEIEPPREDPPDPHAALFEAIADLAGDDTPAIDTAHGPVAITGRRALPAGGIDAASRRLIELLERAAQAAGAVLVTSPEPGALSWTVRLPRDGVRGAEPAPEAAPAPEPPPEAVQPEPIPADNLPETGPPARAALRALVADDSMMARVFLGRLLAQRGIVVEEAEDGAAARSLLDRGGFDFVFLDAEMPGAGALEILRGAQSELVARACVLVKDDEERRLAESFGGLPILYKPFAEDEVRGVVDRLRAHIVN